MKEKRVTLALVTTIRYRHFILALLRLARVWNLIILSVTQLLVATMLVENGSIFNKGLLLLILSTVIIAAAGYIINDYYDIKIDLVNKPDRVVIGKKITRRYAILFHTLLSVTGVLIGFYLNWRIGLINFLAAFLLWWYSNDLKRQPFIGNVVVALLSGVSIAIVDALFQTGNMLIFIYATFAFFIALIREVIKDMEDLKGDDSFGCRTLPIVWGLRKTKTFLYFLILGFAAAIFAVNAIWVGVFMGYLIPLVILPLLWLFIWLTRADTKKDFSRLSLYCKLIMILGVISMIFI